MLKLKCGIEMFEIFLIFVLTDILYVGIYAEVELREEDYNKTWMYMPNGKGEMEVAYLVEPPPEIRSEEPSIIQFDFYGSNANISLTTSMALDENLLLVKRRKRETWEELADRFKPDLDTKILVHGWKSSSRSNSIQAIRYAYTKRGNVNVFAINWSDQADNIYYLQPARYTVHVGRAVAKLIDMLVEEKDANPKQIHLIGHSLGAHIMGYAGSYTKYRVARITGLDPARPAFEDSTGAENHLDVTDAEFVDVIHTCAGVLGYKKPIGTVDFYPNGGGALQPGCDKMPQIFTGCSHGRSCEYFAESINSEKGFMATGCRTIEEANAKNCTGARVFMGDPVLSSAQGIYYVKTSDKPSFALGLDR